MKISLIVHYNLFSNYFEARRMFKRDLKSHDLISIMDNPGNLLVLSRNYINHLEVIFDNKNPLYDDYTNYMTQIIDGNCEKVKSNDTFNEDEELDNLEKSCRTTKVVLLDKKRKKFDCSLVLGQANMSINSKVILNLLKERVAIFRYDQFENDVSIVDFFKRVLKFPKEYDHALIFDRYCNLNHGYFDFLISSRVPVRYYTLKLDIANKLVLKNKFPKLEVFNTNDQNLLHERIIIIGGLIISLDEDPINIKADRKTWTISLQYSNNTATKLIKKTQQFTRIHL